MVLTVLKSIREGWETREFGWLVLAMAAGILAAVGAGMITGPGYVGGGFADLVRNIPEIPVASSTAAGQNVSESDGHNFDTATAKDASEPAAIILAGAGIGLALLVRSNNSRRRERAIRWENTCRALISTTEITGRTAMTSPEVVGDARGGQRRP